MEPIFFLYDEKKKKFHSLVSGMICGGAAELVFSDNEAVARPHCQFRVMHDDVYVLDLEGAGSTRLNGESLRWGEARKLALNDSIEVAGRALILTNRSVFGPGRTQERTRVAEATVTRTLTATEPEPEPETLIGIQPASRPAGASSSETTATNRRGGAESQVLDRISFYQSVWNHGSAPKPRAEVSLPIAGDPEQLLRPPVDSGIRIVSSVSLSAGSDSWESSRLWFKRLAPVMVLALAVGGLLLWTLFRH